MKEINLQAKNEKQLLSRLLEEAGVNIDLPCGGNHTCGKCKVKVSGSLDEISNTEASLLSSTEIENGIRLACFAYALGDVTVYLPKYPSVRILTDTGEPIVTDTPMMDRGKFGAAIDIGTTTVACKLYDVRGQELAVVSAMNTQSKYGADVISRIHQGTQYGNEPIHDAIVAQVKNMLTKLANQAGGSLTDISHGVVVGNTTMLHFFAGLNPEGIGSAPFTPESLFDQTYDNIIDGISFYLPPCISAYVGADLVACLLAARFMEQKNTSLLVDIGTNGEMALIHQGKLICCSTAAGPAFEGAGISCGTNATSGAIVHADYDEQSKNFSYDTLDDASPIGICGSGIIDTCAALYRSGAIKPTGTLLKEGHPLEALVGKNKEFIFSKSKIYFNQKDIRQVQLAKAAIYGGMATLAENCQINLESLQELYLCGGFGSFLDLPSAETIGLIPRGSSKYAKNLGNAALKGAAQILLNQNMRKQVKDITSSCEYLELSGDAEFMDNYISAMNF